MRRIRRDKKRRIRREMKRKNKMVAPVHIYINFDPKWIKKGLAPSNNPSE
jgi:hypothetical protein